MLVRRIAPAINDRAGPEPRAVGEGHRLRGDISDRGVGLQALAQGLLQHGGKTRGSDAEILPGKGSVQAGKADVVSLPAMRHQGGNPPVLIGGNVALMKGPGVVTARLAVGLEQQHAQRRALLSQPQRDQPVRQPTAH